MRIHVPNLPHTRLSFSQYPYCAYTSKVVRFPYILATDGRHSAITYSEGDHDGSELTNTEVPGTRQHELIHVPIDDILLEETGEAPWTGNKLFDIWDKGSRLWVEWNNRCISAIEERAKPGEAIGLIAGNCQTALRDHFKRKHPIVEWGIGYTGVLSDTYKAFEANHWRSAVLGPHKRISHYDRVIPNSYDPGEFLPPSEHQDYLLFVGRLQADKGAAIVYEISKKTDLPIYVAGQGDPTKFGDVTHLGVISGQEKKRWFQGATAVFCPTMYLEPFGGVNVEAQFAGAPAITTDWAAFHETIIQNETGRRCNTLRDFMDAIEWAKTLTLSDRQEISRKASARFSTEVIGRLYGDWLSDIEEIYAGDGWNELGERKTLNG